YHLVPSPIVPRKSTLNPKGIPRKSPCRLTQLADRYPPVKGNIDEGRGFAYILWCSWSPN
ncbi:hypothetical protein NDU88_003035, partial [Pleurodeles waltl]